MSEGAVLDLGLLEKLVAKDVAIRGRATLEPAGGPGDKVFPPSHSVGDRETRAGAKYAFEQRRLPGGEVDICVLLDSVQSQANRMEHALEALWREKKLTLPVLSVDFTKDAPDVGEVTSLSAPHRVADALLRDSMIDGTMFRMSEIGRSFTDATVRNAGALFRVCPTALVFGLWDSTGPKGGLGSKFARALVSEIVGMGAQAGVKTASRIDPAGIVTKAAEIYVAAEPDADGRPTWTVDVLAAKPIDPRKPPKKLDDVELVHKWGKKDKAGKPSSINHSNVPPTIDTVAGGVTIDRAEHTVVLSLAGLRRIGFGEGEQGDKAARTVLAALAVLAVLAAEERGHDLRSRCLLVPRKGHALAFEAVARDGATTAIQIDLEAAIALYEAAVAALPAGLMLKGKGEPLARLSPTPKLIHLVKKSRELAATSGELEEID